MFQIVEVYPVHCQITDGIIGSKSLPLPMTYYRRDYALAHAGRLSRRNYEECGDSSFRVIDTERRDPNKLIGFWFDYQMCASESDGEEIPF